jgi:hypothetical protein
MNSGAMAGAQSGGEVKQMATRSNTPTRPREMSPWFDVGQFVFLIGLAVAVFLLGQSMIHHRFFRGGYINQYGILKP